MRNYLNQAPNLKNVDVGPCKSELKIDGLCKELRGQRPEELIAPTGQKDKKS